VSYDVNRIDISHDDVRCTITTPAPLPAEAYWVIRDLSQAVSEAAIHIALAMEPAAQTEGANDG
jgi:hypothetical protein